MMLDRHESHENLNPKARDIRDAAVSAERPLADREVPLPGVSAADSAADTVQMWLDGEATETEAREANDKAVEFWARVAKDTDTMRQVKAPTNFTASVMAALSVKPQLAD